MWPSPREPDTWLCGFQCLETVAKLPLDRRNASRHAVAHFNVKFHPDGSGEIREVSLWNAAAGEHGRPDPKLPHRWEGRLRLTSSSISLVESRPNTWKAWAIAQPENFVFDGKPTSGQRKLVSCKRPAKWVEVVSRNRRGSSS